MISDKWIYVLNSLAWAIAGMILTLTYQRVAIWWHKRRHDEIRSPLSPQAYLGMIIVMISLVSAAFSGAAEIQNNNNTVANHKQQVAFQSQVVCQNAVNQSNVLIQTERARRSQQDTDNLNMYLDAQAKALANPGPDTIATILAAKAVYNQVLATNNAYRAKNVLTPLSTCGAPVAPPATK